MQRSSLWYLGYDLKRTYQRNLLISMGLVYGPVIVAAFLYVVFQKAPPTFVAQDSIGDGGGRGNSGPELVQVSPGSWRQRGAPLASPEIDSTPTGFFSLGKRIRIVRENYPAVAAAESFVGEFTELPGPEVLLGNGPDDGDGPLDTVVGPGTIDYGLPPGPAPILTYSPNFSAAPGGGRGHIKKNRPLKIHLAALEWPPGTPTNTSCSAIVEVFFSANGTSSWKIPEIKTGAAYTAFAPAFERELKRSLYVMWFEPQLKDGVKIGTTVTLHATFCPSCDPMAWTEEGDMEVFLKK